MAPEVFFSAVYGAMNPGKVFGDLHSFHPGVLDGFVRHRVKWADYPGIIPEDGSSVRGVYATGLTDANMLKLDEFEGTEYVKEQVKVRLVDTGEEKETTVYVYQHPEELEHGEWDFERFKKEKLALWSRRLP